MKRFLFILLICWPALGTYSQQRVDVAGQVINAADDKMLEMVAVGIKELNLWTASDMEGKFLLKNIPPGKYTMQASCLGFEIYEQPVTVSLDSRRFTIRMQPTTLALEEVVVLAKEGKKLGSTSSISQSALEHVQPADLSDVMQLLPGQVSINPDLSDPKQLSIRDISTQGDPMAGLGTLLMIDGAPVSNDANMQTLGTAKASLGTVSSNFASTATGGADVRQIPVDNIESIEVVRGIASAEQGDVLSGVVKVNLKKGKTPWIGKIKIDPNIKQAYVGKGFNLAGSGGAINVDMDFARSVDDIRFPYKTYNRLTGSVAYSNTFLKQWKPLTFSLTGRYADCRDTEETDPDMLDYEKFESHDRNLGLVLSGKWALNTAVLTNLNYNISGNIQHQIGREIDQESLNGPMPQPVSKVAGIFEAPYLPSRYISDVTIDGRPFYFNSKITGTKTFHIGEGMNNLRGGVEYKIYGNNGDGRVYDMAFPPNPTSSGDARPRSYKEIPSLGQLSMFLEEELSLPLGPTKLDLQAGIRFTNVQPESIFRSAENTTMLDPRVNMKYSLIDRNSKGLGKLSLRFGYGVFSKAPTLLHYYPDKAYTDRMSFNYYDPPGSLLLLSTYVEEDTRNYDLKPAYNRKMEAGFDLTVAGVELLVTAFREKMTDGFSFHRKYNLFIYDKYETLSETGLNPYYIPGEGVFYIDPVTGDPVSVPRSNDTIWTSYSYPANTESTTKKGLEYTLDFGTLRVLRTSFVLDGAYLYVKKQDMAEHWEKPITTYQNRPYPFIGIYPAGDGKINQRFNTNIRTVTHIRELRMIVTLTTQIIWFEKTRYIYEDENGNPQVYTEIPVDNVYEDRTQIKYIIPRGYYDLTGTYHEFNVEEATEKPYSDLKDRTGNPYYFVERTYPPIYQINLRMTKELSDGASLSFYVNNITNYKPLQKIGGLINSYTRRNQSIYFGAELKLKF
ncbi:MAG TPA: TonB-dependent receptor [Bacteroidetes bacterium]|nr:TonB-dependent receptor [Bacteroidota bacterium]